MDIITAEQRSRNMAAVRFRKNRQYQAGAVSAETSFFHGLQIQY